MAQAQRGRNAVTESKGAKKMDTCPICGKNVPEGMAQRPKCGAPQEGSKQAIREKPSRGIGFFGKLCLRVALGASMLGCIVCLIAALGVLFDGDLPRHPIVLAMWIVAVPLGICLMVAQVLVYDAVLSFYAMQSAQKDKHDESSTH